MQLPVRLHDATDAETVVRRLLPVLAGPRGERRAAFARLDPARGRLVQRWCTADPIGAVRAGEVDLEPSKVHSLLPDDAQGERPFRPADSAPAWMLRDLFHDLDPERFWVRVRAVTAEGRWVGVLAVAEPRRWILPRREDDADGLGDVLELALARAEAHREREEGQAGRRATLAEVAAGRLRELERETAAARAEAQAARDRLAAMERAHAAATEMLMEAHEELDRRGSRHQRQTRALFLLRRLLERATSGAAPDEVATEIVRTVSEAFGGGRCSLLLVHEGAAEPVLRMGAGVGLPPMVDAGRVAVPFGRGVSGHVARSRTPMVVRDAEEGATIPLVRDRWYTGHAFASYPLLSRGRLLGVLNVSNFRAGTVDDSEVEQLRLVALCAAMVVDHLGLSGALFAGQAA